MSLIRFELKEGHIAMIRNLKWTPEVIAMFGEEDYSKSPFGGDGLIEDLGLILYGMPDGFDPLGEEGTLYTPEQVSEMITLYEDLPTALEVVCNRRSFDIGKFKRKFHSTEWLVDKKK